MPRVPGHLKNQISQSEQDIWMDTRPPVPWLWICSAEVQGEHRQENGNTTTTTITTKEVIKQYPLFSWELPIW